VTSESQQEFHAAMRNDYDAPQQNDEPEADQPSMKTFIFAIVRRRKTRLYEDYAARI
jgi:hypothetical protein